MLSLPEKVLQPPAPPESHMMPMKMKAEPVEGRNDDVGEATDSPGLEAMPMSCTCRLGEQITFCLQTERILIHI